MADLNRVSVSANIDEMPYSVEYFNERVLEQIQRWPVGVLADYARLIELLMEFGADLRMPYSRPLGGGTFGDRHQRETLAAFAALFFVLYFEAQLPFAGFLGFRSRFRNQLGCP